MPVISRVLFDGSYDNYGYVYQLEDNNIVFYSGNAYFESGDELSDNYRPFAQRQFGNVSLEDIVVQQWEAQGPLFYFLKDDNFYSHAFIERDDTIEPLGNLKAEKIEQLYNLENQYMVDFNGDGELGKPPVYIERVLFDGSN